MLVVTQTMTPAATTHQEGAADRWGPPQCAGPSHRACDLTRHSLGPTPDLGVAAPLSGAPRSHEAPHTQQGQRPCCKSIRGPVTPWPFPLRLCRDRPTDGPEPLADTQPRGKGPAKATGSPRERWVAGHECGWAQAPRGWPGSAATPAGCCHREATAPTPCGAMRRPTSLHTRHSARPWPHGSGSPEVECTPSSEGTSFHWERQPWQPWQPSRTGSSPKPHSASAPPPESGLHRAGSPGRQDPPHLVGGPVPCAPPPTSRPRAFTATCACGQTRSPWELLGSSGSLGTGLTLKPGAGRGGPGVWRGRCSSSLPGAWSAHTVPTRGSAYLLPIPLSCPRFCTLRVPRRGVRWYRLHQPRGAAASPRTSRMTGTA